MGRIRINIFCAAFLFLMFNVVLACAQGLPCGGEDPDAPACPIDTWVVVLAGAAFIFAAVHLYRRQKAVQH